MFPGSARSCEGELEEVSKTPAFEVESTGNVAEDSCIGVCDSESGELSLKVGSLLAGADSSVDGVDAVLLAHSSFRESCFVVRVGDACPRGSGDVKENLSDSARLQAFDVSVIGPLLERAPVHAKDRLGLLGLDKLCAYATATVAAEPRCVCLTT